MSVTLSTIYTGNGVQDTFAIPFDYDTTSQVLVSYSAGSYTYTFPSAGFIKLSAPLTNGATVTISRSTNIDAQAESFQAGSGIPKSKLNRGFRQLLFSLQELWSYVNTLAVSAGNVPAPGANVGKWLKATAANAWAWTSITLADVPNALDKTGDTMTGNLVVSGVQPRFQLKNTTQGNAGILATMGVLTRFYLRLNDGTSESGANAGSNADLLAYADDGITLLSTPLKITRANGLVTFASRPVFGTNTPIDTGNLAIPNKNYVINGDMQVAQRGVTFTNPVTGKYTLDRWKLNWDGTGATHSVSQVQATAGSGNPQYKLRVATTVAGTGGTSRTLETRLEKMEQFCGQRMTLSFNAASDSTTARPVSIQQNFGTGGSPSGTVSTPLGTYTPAAAQAVTRYSFTFDVPSSTGKTYGTNGDDYMSIILEMGTNNGVNFWEFADVQLEYTPFASLGTGTKAANGTITGTYNATQFDRRPFALEYLLCQRYYEKSFLYSVAPAQNVGSGTGAVTAASVVGASTLNSNMFGIRYTVRKRGVPTVTLYNAGAANAQARNATLGTDCTGTAANSVTEVGLYVSATTPASTTAGNQISIHYEADAEL